jgi:hypothetical protein
MSTADVARIAGELARRLDSIHWMMLPVVALLAVVMVAAAVPLTAVGAVLVCLRRMLNAAVGFQGRRARTGATS